MRAGMILAAVLALALTVAQGPVNPPLAPATGRMLLVPIDDRPATGQFAQMIAAIAGVTVETPPAELLGRFLTPGDPDHLLEWMERQDLRRFDAVILSTDMIAFGGLISSRELSTSTETALARIERLAQIRRLSPRTPFYAFSAVMRLMPTSTNETRTWRALLVRAIQARHQFLKFPNVYNAIEFGRLSVLLPPGRLDEWDRTRLRNHLIQKELLTRVRSGTFDYLVVGMDDASPVGPQPSEVADLRLLANSLGVEDRTYFCEGIDQHSNVLISRAITREADWVPKVRVVYADPAGAEVIPLYETEPLGRSITRQIEASGAIVTQDPATADYSLFVNTPQPRRAQFRAFLAQLSEEISQGFPVAVADLNLGSTGTGDPRLFDALVRGGQAVRLLSYAGWNTAGNTLGTAVPAANVFLAARRLPVDPVVRELNQRTFLLHRLVNDFEFHRFTRPMANAFIDANPPATRDEAYGEPFHAVNRLVHADVSRRLEEIFEVHLAGRRFFAGTRQFVLDGLEGIQVELPWNRAWEVRIGFRLRAREVR